MLSTTIMEARRKHLTKYLLEELGSKDKVIEFSSNLRYLNICDLSKDEDLKKITEGGYVDTLKVIYQFGTLSKLVEIKESLKD